MSNKYFVSWLVLPEFLCDVKYIGGDFERREMLNVGDVLSFPFFIHPVAHTPVTVRVANVLPIPGSTLVVTVAVDKASQSQ